MKNNKGIKCTVNDYTVNGVFIKDGKPQAIEFHTAERNARAAKAAIADDCGVKASAVLVEFELNKHTFTIDASFEQLKAACDGAGINVVED